MLQETTQAAAATGGNAATALTQMGVDHLLGEMTANPGAYAVSWAVLITLTLMSAMSIYWIVINFFKNAALRRNADRVVSTFWETPNAQDAIRYMEEQPRREPFSKIALDAAQAAAHHQRHEGSRLVESLNRMQADLQVIKELKLRVDKTRAAVGNGSRLDDPLSGNGRRAA